jgi:hypothetical protein
MFNDIQIARYSRTGQFLKYVTIPLKFGPKEKVWYWLNERKDDEVLPIMSASIQGIEYSLERATNKHRNIKISEDANNITRYLNPVPYDINFQVSVWSLYMTDIDQILEQILPYFQPYVFTRLQIPELSSTFDIKVVFTSASPEIDMEWTDDNFRVLKYILDFSVQTYLFRPIETTGKIGEIIINYYQNEAAFGSRLSSSTFTSAASGESQFFSGVSAGATPDDHIYEYELYQFGTKVGKTLTYGD